MSRKCKLTFPIVQRAGAGEHAVSSLSIEPAIMKVTHRAGLTLSYVGIMTGIFAPWPFGI